MSAKFGPDWFGFAGLILKDCFFNSVQHDSTFHRLLFETPKLLQQKLKPPTKISKLCGYLWKG